MSKIKLGVVGVGKIARDQHLPVLAQSRDFELVAAASRSAGVEGVPYYRSLDAMLAAEPSLEAVALCTPPQPREADARLALRHGLHVLLEKPPTTTLSAASELIAAAKTSTLCASWHSRHAPAVAQAKAWLADRRVRAGTIAWKEDIRRWHPGQEWILDVGGMGVFDPGVNALSILTEILPGDVVLTAAKLTTPSNRQAPIAASLTLRTSEGAEIACAFDFLQQGEQVWDIRLDTDGGALALTHGGARLALGGAAEPPPPPDPHLEYKGVYARFAQLIRAGRSDMDVRPLQLAADAFLLGRRETTAPFVF
jgi:D-galactose 1-dehydrogenase